MKTRPRNFFQVFSDALQVENIFKPIKVINRTDSHVIWTCISRDIAHLEKYGSRRLEYRGLKKNSHMENRGQTPKWL